MIQNDFIEQQIIRTTNHFLFIGVLLIERFIDNRTCNKHFFIEFRSRWKQTISEELCVNDTYPSSVIDVEDMGSEERSFTPESSKDEMVISYFSSMEASSVVEGFFGEIPLEGETVRKPDDVTLRVGCPVPIVRCAS